MSALYAMRYLGSTGVGAGSLYIGKGIVTGIDVGGGYYDGTYVEENGRLKGSAKLSAPRGAVLVTGQQLPAGASIALTVDWPKDFANGNAQTVSVNGMPVQVTFEKVRDIP